MVAGRDLNSEPITYRMTAHPCGGANGAPAAAIIFCSVQQKIEPCRSSKKTVMTVLRNFYADDCVKSLNTVQDAVQLVEELRQLLNDGGFKLKKWINNVAAALNRIQLEALCHSLTSQK